MVEKLFPLSPLAAPVIDKDSSDTDLEPGQGAFIDCAVTGLPHPRIEWFVTDEEGRQWQLNTTVGDHYVLHTERLELVDVTQLQTGVYQCQAQNELGTDTKRAIVRVEGQLLTSSTQHTHTHTHTGCRGKPTTWQNTYYHIVCGEESHIV